MAPAAARPPFCSQSPPTGEARDQGRQRVAVAPGTLVQTNLRFSSPPFRPSNSPRRDAIHASLRDLSRVVFVKFSGAPAGVVLEAWSHGVSLLSRSSVTQSDRAR